MPKPIVYRWQDFYLKQILIRYFTSRDVRRLSLGDTLEILILLFLARVALGLHFQTLSSTGDYLRADFQLSYAHIGSLIGLFMLRGLVLAMPTGFIGRNLGDRFLVAGGLALFAAGGFLAAVSSGYDGLAVARIIAGVGFVITTIYSNKMVTDWFAGKELATALSVLVMTWPNGYCHRTDWP